MTTKFAIGIVFRKAEVSAKFHCPTSTETLFSEYGEGRIRSSLVIEIQKRPTDSGGTIIYNYPTTLDAEVGCPEGSCCSLELQLKCDLSLAPCGIIMD